MNKPSKSKLVQISGTSGENDTICSYDTSVPSRTSSGPPHHPVSSHSFTATGRKCELSPRCHSCWAVPPKYHLTLPGQEMPDNQVLESSDTANSESDTTAWFLAESRTVLLHFFCLWFLLVVLVTADKDRTVLF